MKRQALALGTMTLFTIFLVNAVSPAFAVPQDHWVGWWLADSNGNYMLQRGNIGYINPLKDPSVPSGKISKSWVGAQTADGNYWIRVGWYKGASPGGSCQDPSNGLRVYAERYKTGANPAYVCTSTSTTVPIGTAKKYDLKWTQDNLDSTWRWDVWYEDNTSILNVVFPTNEMRMPTLGQIWDEPAPTSELYFRTSSMQYYAQSNDAYSWTNHISVTSNYYSLWQDLADKMRVCGPNPPDSSICVP